jgi:uncharacterized protein YcbX
VKRISRISLAPVKGFVLEHPDEVELTPNGVVENRRFLLVDRDGKRLRSSLTAWPVRVHGRYDAVRERLWMRFPDGVEAEGDALALGDAVYPVVKGKVRLEARVVDGPWTEPLSELAGHPVRLVRPPEVGASLTFPVTLVSEASVERLAREVGEKVDARRFRMLFTLAGCDSHEEDEWEGRLLQVGGAVLRAGGPVDRCAATTRDPDTGKRDLDTLGLIKGYRGMPRGSIDFGIYASVEQPGRVRIGDRVELAHA